MKNKHNLLLCVEEHVYPTPTNTHFNEGKKHTKVYEESEGRWDTFYCTCFGMSAIHCSYKNTFTI